MTLFVWEDFVWLGGWGNYDQLCCPASPKLLLGLDLGLGCDNMGLRLAQPQLVFTLLDCFDVLKPFQ